jgi:dihydroxyacetone kinase-like predicted kinase
MTEDAVQAPQISQEEYKKHRGKDVALYKGKIIAEGATSEEALQKALKKYPKLKPEDVEIYYIESADALIL